MKRRMRFTYAIYIPISESSNSSMSSGRLKKLDCNASDSGAGGANLVVERSESDKARLKNSREAAELRQKLTERGKTGR